MTRKITQAVARIKKGSQKVLYLGNLDSRRDWGLRWWHSIWFLIGSEVSSGNPSRF